MIREQAGFKGGGGVRLSLSGFLEIAACVNSGVSLKGLKGVENAVVAVEEFCVLDIKSGTVLIISSVRVLRERKEKTQTNLKSRVFSSTLCIRVFLHISEF